jgi:hypothetical protein
MRWLLLILLCLPTSLLMNAQEIPLTKHQQVENFYTSILHFSMIERTQELFAQAHQALNHDDWELALLFSEKAMDIDGTNPRTNQAHQSIMRLITLKQAATQDNANGMDINQLPSPLGWTLDSTLQDRQRYLLLFNLFLSTMNTSAGDAPMQTYAGLNANFEGFLPYLERQFGIALSMGVYFLDFQKVNLMQDFNLMHYQALFIWRRNWRIPAVDLATTLAIKFGVRGQHRFAKNDEFTAFDPLFSYVLPRLELSLQHPLLATFFPNDFTENLLISLAIGIDFLPWHKTREAFALDIGAGIYYRIGIFHFGPKYHFQFHRSTSTNRNSSSHIWTLALSTQF